jgi:cardiolipin synthase
MPSRVLTPANEITILRLIFVPVFAILVVGRHYGAGLAVLTAAAVSDGLDGIVARVFRQETPLGVALDPIADKFLMTTAYLTLAFMGALPWWITILVLSRDAAILITALLIVLVAGYRPFHPTFLGKTSTCFQVATIFLALGFEAHVPLVTHALVHVSIYLTAAFTVASGIHYLTVVRHRSGHQPSEQVAPAPAPAEKAARDERSAAALASTESRSRHSS